MSKDYQPTIPSFAVHGWGTQKSQYAPFGPPGISFERNEVADLTTVDCLLWRDSTGVLRAILNHFPEDVHVQGQQVEKAGNVNIYVDPGWQRRRLATLLLDEANARFGPINLDQQALTPAGALFARRYQPAELVPVTELRENDMIDLTGDPHADPGHGWDGHDCKFPDGVDLTVVGGEDGPGELETPGCYRVDHWYGAHGFPPEHKVRRVGVYTPTSQTLPPAPAGSDAPTPIHDAIITGRTTMTKPATPAEDAAEDAREQAASEALLTGAPSSEDVAYWCETVAEKADSPITLDAIARVTGQDKPGLLLRVAADLYQDNPEASSLYGLDEMEYLDIVLAARQVQGEYPDDPDKVARDLRESLLSRWNTKAEAATELIDNCLGDQWVTNMQVNRHRLTDEDIEAVERDATGDRGVSIAETDDGWYVIVDCTI